MTSLSKLSVGLSASVSALRVPAREAAWLRAVGLGEGMGVTVLRKAPLGGPLHVRLSGGAELAVDRALAACVDVSASQVSS